MKQSRGYFCSSIPWIYCMYEYIFPRASPPKGSITISWHEPTEAHWSPSSLCRWGCLPGGHRGAECSNQTTERLRGKPIKRGHRQRPPITQDTEGEIYKVRHTSQEALSLATRNQSATVHFHPPTSAGQKYPTTNCSKTLFSETLWGHSMLGLIFLPMWSWKAFRSDIFHNLFPAFWLDVFPILFQSCDDRGSGPLLGSAPIPSAFWSRGRRFHRYAVRSPCRNALPSTWRNSTDRQPWNSKRPVNSSPQYRYRNQMGVYWSKIKIKYCWLVHYWHTTHKRSKVLSFL